MRLFIVANMEKHVVARELDELVAWLRQRVEVSGVEVDGKGDLGQVEADAILVLGGDGTLLSVARQLKGRQLPVMGVNYGRLGFLASFVPGNFKSHFERLLTKGMPAQKRMMLEASVVPPSVHSKGDNWAVIEKERRFVATALNDTVVTAGPPFHMIELEVCADSEEGVKYFGDGVIISTPSGSTAYNVSAGGPIIIPGVDAMCITPLAPHSLSFRPVVISDQSVAIITAVKVNQGTTLFCDGQASTQLHAGQRVIIRRSPHDVLLVENPDARQWRTLAEKLHWAASPNYGADSGT